MNKSSSESSPDSKGRIHQSMDPQLRDLNLISLQINECSNEDEDSPYINAKKEEKKPSKFSVGAQQAAAALVNQSCDSSSEDAQSELADKVEEPLGKSTSSGSFVKMPTFQNPLQLLKKQKTKKGIANQDTVRHIHQQETISKKDFKRRSTIANRKQKSAEAVHNNVQEKSKIDLDNSREGLLNRVSTLQENQIVDSFISSEEEDEDDLPTRKSSLFFNEYSIQRHKSALSAEHCEHAIRRESSLSIKSDGSLAEEVKKYERELVGRESKVELFRQRFVISQQSSFYQVWKMVGIVVSFITSFWYVYDAAFLHKMTEDELAWQERIDVLFSSFFLVDLIVNIALDEHLASEGRWTLKKSCSKQLRGNLFLNVVPLIPFPKLLEGRASPRFCQLTHMLKAIRMINGLELLDYKTYKRQLHAAQNRRIQKMLSDPEKANDQVVDSAKMSSIILMTEILKTVRLIVIILFLSFFTGLAWYVVSDLNFKEGSSTELYFVHEYGMTTSTDHMANAFALTYFTFTTLSTVGLGDFHPKSNLERIICSFVMLFGVMITSILMDNFAKMLKRLRNFNKPYEEADQLNLFCGTLKKFNGGVPIPKAFENRLDRYFQYRWHFNRNLAISTEADLAIYEELPGRIQTQLFVDFLFKKFMEIYKNFLDIHQTRYELKRKALQIISDATLRFHHITQLDWTKYYSDYSHDEFIIAFLRELEPITTPYGKVLQRQDQDVTEIYFPMRGEIHVGFNFKRYLQHIDMDHIQFPFKKTDPCFAEVRGRVQQNIKQIAMHLKTIDERYQYPVISEPGQVSLGLFEMLFSRKSQFSYKILRDEDDPIEDRDKIADCYFMRQSSWRRILQNEEESEQWQRLFALFRHSALVNYINKVYLPIRDQQQFLVQKENFQIFKEYNKKAEQTALIFNKEEREPERKVSGTRERRRSIMSDQMQKRKISQMICSTLALPVVKAAAAKEKQKKAEQEALFENVEAVVDKVMSSQLTHEVKPIKQLCLLLLHQAEEQREEKSEAQMFTDLQAKVNDHQNLAMSLLFEYHLLLRKFTEQSKQVLSLKKELLEMKDRQQQPFPGLVGKSVLIQEEKDRLKNELVQVKSINESLQKKLNDEISQKASQKPFHSEFSFKMGGLKSDRAQLLLDQQDKISCNTVSFREGSKKQLLPNKRPSDRSVALTEQIQQHREPSQQLSSMKSSPTLPRGTYKELTGKIFVNEHQKLFMQVDLAQVSPRKGNYADSESELQFPKRSNSLGTRSSCYFTARKKHLSNRILKQGGSITQEKRRSKSSNINEFENFLKEAGREESNSSQSPANPLKQVFDITLNQSFPTRLMPSTTFRQNTIQKMRSFESEKNQVKVDTEQELEGIFPNKRASQEVEGLHLLQLGDLVRQPKYDIPSPVPEESNIRDGDSSMIAISNLDEGEKKEGLKPMEKDIYTSDKNDNEERKSPPQSPAPEGNFLSVASHRDIADITHSYDLSTIQNDDDRRSVNMHSAHSATIDGPQFFNHKNKPSYSSNDLGVFQKPEEGAGIQAAFALAKKQTQRKNLQSSNNLVKQVTAGFGPLVPQNTRRKSIGDLRSMDSSILLKQAKRQQSKGPRMQGLKQTTTARFGRTADGSALKSIQSPSPSKGKSSKKLLTSSIQESSIVTSSIVSPDFKP